LLNRYETAEQAFNHLPDIMRRKRLDVPATADIEKEMEICDSLGIHLIASCEPDYPLYLRAIDPPPPIISVWGDVTHLHKPCVAIIGSRNASAIGQRFARQIASELGAAGYVIVSGLARGIDTMAHQGSISTGTVAVLGGGIDHIYPRQNADLFEDIKNTGALISESPIGYRATARDFPRRNRIISGLSQGVVVIEAAERSGTLITARYALEQNREVMAAPGSPLDPRTKGCNRLIRQGAALIENADDVIKLLEQVRSPAVFESKHEYLDDPNQSADHEPSMVNAKASLLKLMSSTPTPRDEIIRLSGLPVSVAVATLLELELIGTIDVEPDGRISYLPESYNP
jgi:DNA processing protein